MEAEKKLKILIYSDHFFPSIGGSENYALDLANELSRKGHIVGVISAEPNNHEDNFAFKVYRLEKPLSLHRINFNFVDIPRVVKAFKPNVFHISYQTGGENILIALLKLMRIPIVLTYHADHVVPIGRLLDNMQYRFLFRFCDVVMVQSKRDKQAFIKNGFQADKIQLFSFSGVDTGKYKCKVKKNPSSLPFRLVCVARLDDSHKYKGIEVLIELFRMIKSMGLAEHVEAIIVGDGNLKYYYENTAKSMQLNNIRFLGNLSDEDLIDEMCRSDGLILPSNDKGEGFGRVVLEGMSCGLLAIVSRLAGVAELTGKYNAGIVFDPQKLNLLIGEIESLLQNYNKYKEYTDNAKKMLIEESLTLEKSVEHTLDLYHEFARNWRG